MKKNHKLPELEVVAAKVHETWMEEKNGQGITSRLSPSGEELMRPYAELSEEAKDTNRNMVNTVYKAIEELTPEEETEESTKQEAAHSTL